MDNTYIETHYRKYLKMVGLRETDMHPKQRTETKRAFFAAWGMCLLNNGEKAERMTEQQTVTDLRGQLKQVGKYFDIEINKEQ